MSKLRDNGITTPIFWYNLREGRSATAGYGLEIYDNAIASGWNDASYGLTSRDLCDGTRTVSPSCAFGATIFQEGAIAFTLAFRTISTANYQALDWCVYLNGSSINGFKVYLEDSLEPIQDRAPGIDTREIGASSG